MKSVIIASALLASAAARNHENMGPLNPALGVHGFPDCVQPGPISSDVEEAQQSMVCSQQGSAAALKIACVGDSITAGAHASNASMAYPQQLQRMLDASQYAVTNLGECGSTMQKNADSPYWKRNSFTTLTKNTWDIVVIMLGTNDAKDHTDNGPSNWGCGVGSNVTVASCQFAQDYLSFIALVKTLGPGGKSPVIFVMKPAPLMSHGAIGANQTVINSVFPSLIPMIATAAGLTTPVVDVFGGMGGVADWQTAFPPSCEKVSPWKPCAWFCDDQSCDQCHPNNNGYTHLAMTVKAGLGL